MLPLDPRTREALDRALSVADRERIIYDAGGRTAAGRVSMQAVAEQANCGQQLNAHETSNWMLGWTAPRAGL